MKRYSIYAKGRLTKKQCRIADNTVKSGMIEAVEENLVLFHSLKKEDIKSAQEVMKQFGFDVEPEIFEERYYGSFCDEVDVTNEIAI